MEMNTVIINGSEVDFDASVILMDDEIREELCSLGLESKQEFADAYAAAHLAKFAETFVVA